MPANTKLHRSRKLAGVQRRVYVSWLDDREHRVAWVREFKTELKLATRQYHQMFVPLSATDDKPAGTVHKEWLDDTPIPITDVIGVLTNVYINDNTDSHEGPATGELAHFFDLVLADSHDRLRIFLAPVDTTNWRYMVRNVPLDSTWLTRLKKERFVWPSEDGAAGRCADEIAAAVRVIVDLEVASFNED